MEMCGKTLLGQAGKSGEHMFACSSVLTLMNKMLVVSRLHRQQCRDTSMSSGHRVAVETLDRLQGQGCIRVFQLSGAGCATFHQESVFPCQAAASVI